MEQRFNLYVIAKPEPFMILATDGTLLTYGSERTVRAQFSNEQWQKWSTVAAHFDRLGFEDGLQIPPVSDAGDGRLTLSGPSLWRLATANAGQREPKETTAEPVGRFFYDREDRQRATHWINYVLPELLHPGAKAIPRPRTSFTQCGN